MPRGNARGMSNASAGNDTETPSDDASGDRAVAAPNSDQPAVRHIESITADLINRPVDVRPKRQPD